MASATQQTDKIVSQLTDIGNLGGSIMKLVGFFSKTKVQEAYDKLDAMRTSGGAFAVVTPWAVFGGLKDNGHGPMMIESLVMVSPEETRGVADIVIRLKEIRTAPSLLPVKQDSARAPGASQNVQNGSVAAKR